MTAAREAPRGVDRTLLAVLALALGLRAAWAWFVPVDPVSDSNAYHVFARNLAEHGVFGWRADARDAYWPPGAPFLYSLAYRLLGPGGAAVVSINLAVAAAKLLLLWRVTRVWFGREAAVAACLALAFWPAQIEFTTVLSSEHPFDVALLGALCIFERNWRAPSVAAAAALGAALAAASYLRPTALPLSVGLAIIAWARGAPLAKSARLAVVASLVMAALIAPWSLRNYRVFGRLVPVSANGGSNLWMGNNPHADGGYMPLPREVARLNTAERDARLSALAKSWMLENPGSALRLTARKLTLTYGRETIGIAWNERALARASEGTVIALKAVSTGYWWILLLLGLTGAGLRVRSRGVIAMVADAPIALWGYFALVHSITVAQDRYHLSSVPFIAALAGVAAAQLARRLSPARSSALPSPPPAA